MGARHEWLTKTRKRGAASPRDARREHWTPLDLIGRSSVRRRPAGSRIENSFRPVNCNGRNQLERNAHASLRRPSDGHPPKRRGGTCRDIHTLSVGMALPPRNVSLEAKPSTRRPPNSRTRRIRMMRKSVTFALGTRHPRNTDVPNETSVKNDNARTKAKSGAHSLWHIAA